MKESNFAVRRTEEVPEDAIVISEDDFEPDAPAKEPSFALTKVNKPPRPDSKRMETTKTENFSDLFDEEPDATRSSGIYESFSTPQELQQYEVVEAMTFPTANGLEMGISVAKKPERTGSESNEDCVLVFEDTDLGVGYGSFDGLGGEGKKGSGALASAKVAEVLPNYLIEENHRINSSSAEEAFNKLPLVKFDETLNEPVSAKAQEYSELDPAIRKKAVVVAEAFIKANKDIVETGGKTTACFTLVHTTEDGRRFAITANVGDGGALLRRANGEVNLLTKEDSLLNEMQAIGLINDARLQEMKTAPTTPFKLFEVQQNFETLNAKPAIRKQFQKLGALTDEMLKEMQTEPGKLFTLKIEMSYNKLKSSNSKALGDSSITAPRISITEMQPGDEIYNVTDGILDFYEDETGDLDVKSIEGALNRGTTLKERIDSVREIAGIRSKLIAIDDAKTKDTDDSAISGVRYAEAA